MPEMHEKLTDVLNNKYGNYVMPFFWQHGEDDAAIVEELEMIRQSGIRAVCVESRVHEGFGRQEWWEDFGLILQEAEKRGMKVWLLDDKHFPTGYANGLIKEKYPHLRKWHLREEHVDVAGPRKGAAFLCRPIDPRVKPESEESLVLAIACKRTGDGESLGTESINLTGFIKGDFLYWDVPEGYYRIFFLIKTREGSSYQPDYIHLIDPASVEVLIEAVYQPHYERYERYFGNTFAGFFSDEPSFGNEVRMNGGPGFYDSRIGSPGMALPWRDDLITMLSEHIGEDASLLLPGIWYDMGSKTSLIRTAYMDILTSLYRKCFCDRLSGWCHMHGVEYIGHVIEDMNAHARLGSSTGHYFRSLAGQDMSGIDLVLHQIVPGFSELQHSVPLPGGKVDPAFFDYMLGKLAASLAHMEPHMKGRAMCEIYGAYGWAEGMPLMKWLTDHMLVRGVNYFVPHAFSPKFPNNDCPPHFYARGNNPQFKDFKVLMDYTNKMSHLLTDGRHVATAAILYHAEAEWSGGRYMLTEVPAKALYDEQIDFDIVPIDTLLNDAAVADKKLVINNECFDCLIIPYSQILPIKALKRIGELSGEGLCTIFVDSLPEKSSENMDTVPYFSGAGQVVCPLDKLAGFLIDRGYFDIRLHYRNPLIRFYHYIQGQSHIFMFFNESLSHQKATVKLPYKGEYIFLDLMQDIAGTRGTADGNVALDLSPYQSCLLVFTDEPRLLVPRLKEESAVRTVLLEGPYDISISRPGDLESCEAYKSGCGLVNITGPDELPEFSGVIRYTSVFEYTSPFKADGAGGSCRLDLGEVGETARVRVNGTDAGTRICPPYIFDIGSMVRKGENVLEVEVANTLVFRLKDRLSRYLPIPPSGLLGPVRLIYGE